MEKRGARQFKNQRIACQRGNEQKAQQTPFDPLPIGFTKADHQKGQRGHDGSEGAQNDDAWIFRRWKPEAEKRHRHRAKKGQSEPARCTMPALLHGNKGESQHKKASYRQIDRQKERHKRHYQAPSTCLPAPWVRGPNHPISQTHFRCIRCAFSGTSIHHAYYRVGKISLSAGLYLLLQQKPVKFLQNIDVYVISR